LKRFALQFIILGLVLLLCSGCARRTAANPGGLPATSGAALQPGTFTRTLSVNSSARSYRLHLPPGFNAQTPLPLVLVFHGGGGNAENAASMTGFDAQADRAGFAVVYPNGSGRQDDKLLTWNAGTCCGYAVDHQVDDVGFIRALLADLATSLTLDNQRIFATGISNGGMFSYRLACELSDQLAAVAPVSGTLNYAACAPAEPVSILHIHGTADEHVPYEGGYGSKSLVNVDFASVASSLNFWISFNRCPATSLQTQIGAVAHDVYAPCAQNTTVELDTIPGGKHAWPGGQAGWLGGDEPSNDLDATTVIWEFFAAHPKK
jgi:polyhydroxybutyrate depolymerase